MAFIVFVLISLVWARSCCCEEYLMAMASSSREVYISATVGQTEGSVHVQLPNVEESEFHQLGPYSRRLVTIPPSALTELGIGNQTIIVNTSSNAVTINGYYLYSAFSPLPISVLGTRYILPYCNAIRTTSILVIAAYKKETEVEITFRLSGTFKYQDKSYIDGDTLTQHLNPFETFSFNIKKHNITGTVVQTTAPVAIYMGTTYSTYIGTYDQLLPVNAHGKEYVVAVDDNRYRYTLHIVGDHSDTEINFSDGNSVSRRFYSQLLQKNETLHFSSTKPVMATLCRKDRNYHQSIFVTLPPVSSYRQEETSLYIPYTAITSTIKVLTAESSSVKGKQYSQPQLPNEWKLINESEYSVWTYKIQNKVATSFTSNGSYNLLVYSQYYLQNGGYTYRDGNGIFNPRTDPADSQTTPQALSGTMPATDGGKAAMIVGIVCGIIIAVLLVIIAVLIYRVRKNKGQKEDPSHKPNAPPARSAVQGGVANPAVVYDGDDVNEATYTELVNAGEHNYNRM